MQLQNHDILKLKFKILKSALLCLKNPPFIILGILGILKFKKIQLRA